MPNTYSQLYIQVVFTVKGRENLLNYEIRNNIFKYITGIISAKGHKSIIVDGYSDHIHCLIGLKPTSSVSDLVRDIKNNSSKFINQEGYFKHKFSWQEGYGVFSYSHSQLNKVYNYILNQEKHHRIKNFKEEYLDLLQKFEIEYDPKYLFDFIE